LQYIGLRQGGSFPFSVHIVRDAEKLGKIKMTANLPLVWCGPKIEQEHKNNLRITKQRRLKGQAIRSADIEAKRQKKKPVKQKSKFGKKGSR